MKNPLPLRALLAACLSSCALLGCASLTDASASTAEHNEALVRRVFAEAWSGDLDVLDEVLSSGYHLQENEERHNGAEDYKDVIRGYRSAFPDLEFRVLDSFACGDRVTVHWQSVGTNTGMLGSIPVTGRSVAVHGITISRVSGGRIVEEFTTWDQHGLLEQLGVLP